MEETNVRFRKLRSHIAKIAKEMEEYEMEIDKERHLKSEETLLLNYMKNKLRVLGDEL